MAVTFHDIPQKYAPSDNPVTYRFSSNQTAGANFSFLVETYINGAVVATDKVFFFFPRMGFMHTLMLRLLQDTLYLLLQSQL